MNIGFIGVGGVAQAHLKNVSAIRGARIVAVCDIQEDRARAAAATYGGIAYTNYRRMLLRESLDACYVCVIPAAHGRIELDLARARLPFFMEKPVNLSLDAAREVIEALQHSGSISCVGYHWRYTKASRAARRFAQRKGGPRFIEGAWYGAFVGVPWWCRMELSGGQIVEQTTHIFDTARYLAGEVHTVYASGTTGAMTDVADYDIHDASVTTLQFDSGAVGQITSGCITEGHDQETTGITVRGRGWSAWTDSFTAVTRDSRGEKKFDSSQEWSQMLGNGDRAFIRAVRTDDASGIASDYADAAQTLAITLAANKSMTSGREVKVQRLM